MPTSLIPTGADLWSWIDRIGIVLFDATLSATLFFSLILLAMLACRQPARRIFIARVALLASLAIVPMVGLHSLPRVDVVDILIDSKVVPRMLLTAPDAGAAAVDLPGVPGIHGSARRIVASLLSRSPPTLRWIERGLVFLDLTGVGIGLAWLLLGFGGVRWLIRHSQGPSPATSHIYDEVSSEGLRAGRRPELRVSARIHHPVVVGFLRPTILIPSTLDRPSDDREPLRLTFLHELAHIARWDHRFGIVASLAQSVWFLLPHTWWLRSQLRIDQEFLADRIAAGRYGTSSDYASSLLTLASAPAANPTKVVADSEDGPASPTSVGVPSALFQRILMLLHCPFPIEARTPRLWSWTSRVSIVAASVLAACLVIRWPDVGAAKSDHAPTQLQIQSFKLEPLVVGPGGRSVAYSFPVHLPPKFDLDVEVQSNPVDLPEIRIAGHPLKTAGPLPADPIKTSESRSRDERPWHRVHVHRDRERLTIQVDGQSVSDESLKEPTSESLIIEPGTQGIAEFRELKLSW